MFAANAAKVGYNALILLSGAPEGKGGKLGSNRRWQRLVSLLPILWSPAIIVCKDVETA